MAQTYTVDFPFNFYDYSYHNTFSVDPKKAGMIVRTYDSVNGITLFHWVSDSESADHFIEKNYSGFSKKITDEKEPDLFGTMCYHYDKHPFYVDLQTVNVTRDKVMKKILSNCKHDLRDVPLSDGLPYVARLYRKLTENDKKKYSKLLEEIRLVLKAKNAGFGFDNLENL